MSHLHAIVELEHKAKQVTRNVERLAFLGKLTEQDARGLKENYDLYYVYHEAAAVSLAQGELEAYRSHVRSAKSELDAMEMTLKFLNSRGADEPEAQRPAASAVEL